MNAYGTYTKSTNGPSEQIPMHTEVEGPACLWTTLSDALKSNGIHQSCHFSPYLFLVPLIEGGKFLWQESLPPYFSTITCQITHRLHYGRRKWAVRAFQTWTRDIQTLLGLPNFSVQPIVLAFWHESLAYMSSLLKPTYFTHLLSFLLSAWAESTALPETPYTVGGQQQPQNTLQTLNKIGRK